VEKALRSFTLNEFAGMSPSLTPGETYSIRVRVVFEGDAPAAEPNVASNIWPQYGKACTLKVPAASVGKTIAPEFKAVAYPNPFAENFQIDVTTAGKEDIVVKVYDMTGRILESHNVSIADVKSLQVGDRYPSGVYNVIVTQGDNVRTLRVIKR
jgi:hypothetical protein